MHETEPPLDWDSARVIQSSCAWVMTIRVIHVQGTRGIQREGRRIGSKMKPCSRESYNRGGRGRCQLERGDGNILTFLSSPWAENIKSKMD